MTRKKILKRLGKLYKKHDSFIKKYREEKNRLLLAYSRSIIRSN